MVDSPAMPGGVTAAAAATAQEVRLEAAMDGGHDSHRLPQLLERAQQFPLLPGEQRELVGALRASAAAVAACRADLDQFRGLVEHNPLVAAWVSGAWAIGF